jgi:hypothetical protein
VQLGGACLGLWGKEMHPLSLGCSHEAGEYVVENMVSSFWSLSFSFVNRVHKPVSAEWPLMAMQALQEVQW